MCVCVRDEAVVASELVSIHTSSTHHDISKALSFRINRIATIQKVGVNRHVSSVLQCLSFK